MDNYMRMDSFITAIGNAPRREVLRGGAIYLYGRRYEHKNLLAYVGQSILAFTDLDGADAVCLTLFDKHFICNAHNTELWAEMLADCGLEPNQRIHKDAQKDAHL